MDSKKRWFDPQRDGIPKNGYLVRLTGKFHLVQMLDCTPPTGFGVKG